MPWNQRRTFSWSHGAVDGDPHRIEGDGWRGAARLLYLRPDPDERASRSDLGHGIRPRSDGDDRAAEAILSAGHSGELASPVYPRSRNADGSYRPERER